TAVDERALVDGGFRGCGRVGIEIEARLRGLALAQWIEAGVCLAGADACLRRRFRLGLCRFMLGLRSRRAMRDEPDSLVRGGRELVRGRALEDEGAPEQGDAAGNGHVRGPSGGRLLRERL